jgi:hypothetical protein
MARRQGFGNPRPGGRLPSIAVIAPEKALSKLSGRLGRILEGSGVKTAILGSEPPAGSSGRVWVLAPSQARGLEFEGVLAVDPPPGPLLRLIATRAAAYFGVLFSADALPELATLVEAGDWAQPEVPLETLDI